MLGCAVLAWVVRVSLLMPAAALLTFAGTANGAWFDRHVEPAFFPGPLPRWAPPVVRAAAVVLGLTFGFLAAAIPRRVKVDAVARVVLAVAMAGVAAELTLRALRHLLPTPNANIEEFLAVPDPRTGWAFVPKRTVDL